MTIGPDLVGRKVGQLMILEQLPIEISTARSGKRVRTYRYRCRCSCGKLARVRRGNLTSQHTLSCGCLKRRKGKANPGWRGHGQLSGYLWAHIKHHTQRSSRTLPFTITIEEAWLQFRRQDGRCALTGWPLIIDHSSHGKSSRTASLDRIDSRFGYETGNIQWVHKDVNQMKWELSNARFVEVCCAVVQHTEVK